MPPPPPLPSSPPTPGRRAWGWLVAGLFLGVVWCLGTRGLNEPDEGRYASMARAMVETGDWWTPRLSGYEHYDKPPMLYWTTALAFRLFGFNEWAARLPSVCGAVGALVGLGWTAWRLHGSRVAWWAVLVCGTLVQFWTCARLLTPDMLLTGWCALAVGAWAECRHRGGAWGWWALSLGFWTLGWWTKATPVLVPLLALAVGTWATGDRAGLRALRLPLLLPGTVLLGLPWYAAMLHAHPDLWNYFLGKELAGRLSGAAHRRGGPWFYYGPVSAVAWLPWWPLATWAAWQGRAGFFRVAGLARRVGTEGWLVAVGLTIFSVNGSKLPTYTLVLAPWAALGLARLVLRLPRPGLAGGVAAAAFALVTLTGAWLVPRWESRLGMNGSVREVCRETAVGTLCFDRPWPGAEFYRPGQVRFVADDAEMRERSADPGPVQPTFLDPRGWRETAATLPGPVWLVRYRKARKSPFPPAATPELGLVIGDWEVSRFSTTPGEVTP